MNDGRPFHAAARTAEIVREVELLGPDFEAPEVRMDVLHTHSVALALSGQMTEARAASAAAAAIARSLVQTHRDALDVLSTHGNIEITVIPLRPSTCCPFVRTRSTSARPSAQNCAS